MLFSKTRNTRIHFHDQQSNFYGMWHANQVISLHFIIYSTYILVRAILLLSIPFLKVILQSITIMYMSPFKFIFQFIIKIPTEKVDRLFP